MSVRCVGMAVGVTRGKQGLLLCAVEAAHLRERCVLRYARHQVCRNREGAASEPGQRSICNHALRVRWMAGNKIRFRIGTEEQKARRYVGWTAVRRWPRPPLRAANRSSVPCSPDALKPSSPSSPASAARGEVWNVASNCLASHAGSLSLCIRSSFSAFAP